MSELKQIKSYHDLIGDGGSQVIEQVKEKQGLIANNLSGIRHMIAVGSAKGGVGKSTLTMQLGSALNRLGFRVSLLDVDVNGPSLARLSGLENTLLVPGKKGLSVPKTKDGIGVLSFGSMVPDTEAVAFHSVSLGDSHTWRATKEFSVLGDFLGYTAWGDLDYLLIDLPPGAEKSLQFAEFFGPRTNHILITIPSMLAYGVVNRGIHALKKSQASILGYIENMSGYYCYSCKTVKALFPHTEEINLNIPLLGKIPFDPEIAKMCDEGKQIPVGTIHQVAEKVVSKLEN